MSDTAEYSRMVDMVIYDRASVEDCIDNKVQAMILALAILDQAGCAVKLTQGIAEQLGVAEEWSDLPYEEP